MVCSNVRNIPDFFVEAFHVDNYDYDDNPKSYSATTLIDSPQIVQLKRRHKDKFVLDAKDWFYSFRGNAIHDAFGKALTGNPRYVLEERIQADILPTGSTDPEDMRTITGKPDCVDLLESTVLDHKTTTTFIMGLEQRAEWLQQLNIYAWLLRKNNIAVNKVGINAIYLDWREAAGKYKGPEDYPQAPVAQFIKEAWSMDKCEDFIRDRLALHVEAEQLPDDQLPLCTSAEMWERPAKYAVYNPGATRATRLLNTEEEAIDYIKWKNLTGYKIERRPSERTRCESYCECRDFCNQYKEYKHELSEQGDRVGSGDIDTGNP